MSKKSIKSLFSFNKQERNGIFFLLFIIVVLQLLYYFGTSYPHGANKPHLEVDAEFQSIIEQLKIDSEKQDSVIVYKYNPNYITDYKGYVLGMSPEEIDRLHLFRADLKYVNSAEEFQKITLISDSLLSVLAPNFKFPEWTQNSSKAFPEKVIRSQKRDRSEVEYTKDPLSNNPPQVSMDKDINSATAADLRAIVGVGEVLSKRIIKFRDRLGGFVVEKQLQHVYGLEKEVVERIWAHFKIVDAPGVIKINLNDASASDLVELIYIDYKLANRIVAYRENNGAISAFDELLNIEDFPSEKIDIIQLYLQL